VRRRAAALTATGLLALGALATTVTSGPPAAAAGAPRVPDLQLVTLVGPGTSGGDAPRSDLLRRQDRLLASVGAPEPAYRWTTALNGFAVRLTPAQVASLSGDPGVAAVEPNTVVEMAASPVSTASTATSSDVASHRLAPGRRLRGGAGVVIGVVDSGLDPSAPVFSDVPGLGPDSPDFDGACLAGEDWAADTCGRKVVGARWFVTGFGADRVRSAERLSPRDVAGHGTQVASVAAGNAGVTVRMAGRNHGDFGGVAPQARLAVYKACWSAPDPADDGCATADVVTAVDQATADGVDVLTLALGGSERAGAVERALLGAAEADVVAIAAAGNADDTSYAAHGSPWVTTVGATVGRVRQGSVTPSGGPTLVGGSRIRSALPPMRVVVAGDAAVPGAVPRDAQQCRPGALDAAAVADKVVVCERGGIGRVDKSAAVAQADGAAMVLLNAGPGSVDDDFHSVPTVHLAAPAARRLRGWLADHPDTLVRLGRVDPGRQTRSVAAWSAAGDPRGSVLKPDVVAAGGGVLAAVPGSTGGAWSTVTGTSAAAAQTAGLAALLRGGNDWPATRVRSVLSTTATAVPGEPVLRQGAGQVRSAPVRPGLALDVDVSDYRRFLEGRADGGGASTLNTPSLLLGGGRSAATREITNIGGRAEYFSVSVAGFDDHRVRVTPLAVRLAPGETADFRVTVDGPGVPTGLDDGSIRWRGARGSVTRIPVAIVR
jgi:hypothetical protein